MTCRLRDLSIAMTVLSLTVVVAIAVSLLGTSMYEAVDSMASVSRDLAFGLAREIVREQGIYLALEVETKIFRPIKEVVEVGAVSARIVGNGSILNREQSIHVAQVMLDHVQGSTHLIPREGWIVNYANNTPQAAFKAGIDDTHGRILKQFSTNYVTVYKDRYPVPLDEDVIQIDYDPAPDSLVFDYARVDNTIAFMWTKVTWDNPEHELEVGYGGPILHGRPLGDDIFIFTETSLVLLRSLLQSLVRGGEPVLAGYTDPAYVPILNETILCILERESGLLLECSHGFSTEYINGSWHRMKGADSQHPVIGPGMAVTTRFEFFQGDVFSTVGTESFPLSNAARYFIHKEAFEGGPPWSRVVITPYDQLLREVEDETEQTRDEAMATIVVTVSFSVGITLAAILVSAVIAAKISRPLSDLAKDMQRMEVMNTAGVISGKNSTASAVREVEEMKVSFLAMVSKLVEYKSFIPKHLVEEGDDSEDCTLSDSRHTSSLDNLKDIFALELMTRACAVSTLTLAAGDLDNDELASSYNTLFEGVLFACVGTNPHITLTFDSIIIGFNAAARLFNFKERGLRCMVGFTQGTSTPIAVGCSYELTQAAVGNVGTFETRYYAVCPDSDVRSRVVPMYSAKKGWGFVYCSEQVVRTCQEFFFLNVDLLTPPSGATIVSRCLQEKPIDTEEWMYSIDTTTALPHVAFNRGFEYMLNGKLGNATTEFKACRKHFPVDTEYFLQLLRTPSSESKRYRWVPELD